MKIRPIDLVVSWLVGALAILAAPEGLSTGGYLLVAAVTSLACLAVLTLATWIERR